MRTNSHLVLFLFLAGTVFATGCKNDKFSGNAERTAKSRRTAIEEEIKKLGEHEWAGEYYAGDGLGVNTSFALAPESGYVFEWHGCVGVYDRNFGAVTWTNGRIHLAFTFNNKRQGFQGVAPEFIPIRWGQRHYLVPADEMVGFCNEVNEQMEPRDDVHGSYLLRQGDEKMEVAGIPVLPKEYQSYLLTNPIEAIIVSVGKYATRPSLAAWKFKDTPVTLNAGSNQGLRPGMELNVIEPKNLVESVKITKVEANRSEAIMTQIGEECAGPKVGWKFSTLPSWRKTTKNKNEAKRSNE